MMRLFVQWFFAPLMSARFSKMSALWFVIALGSSAIPILELRPANLMRDAPLVKEYW